VVSTATNKEQFPTISDGLYDEFYLVPAIAQPTPPQEITPSTSTGEYIDDAVISTKVKVALNADDKVSDFQVNVETFKGTVLLSGFVDTMEQAERAEEIARSVDGVKNVLNNMTIK
jgi:hyperosmotically inducible periplasmic protein